MVKIKLILLLIFSVSCTFASAAAGSSRHRRHRSHHRLHSFTEGEDQFDDESGGGRIKEIPMSCEQRCQAQFEADYQSEFGEFYVDLHWFPIHHLLTQSEQKLRNFCSYAFERNSCMSNCGSKESPWTPLQHLCIEHQEDFIKILPCLRATSDMEKCSATCKAAATRYTQFSIEKSLDFERSRDVDRRSLSCFYQLCILECRSRLIDAHCADTEIDGTKDFLRRYYSDDAFHEALKKPKIPGLCQKLINQDSNRPWRSQTLEPLDEGMIREMRSKIDLQVSDHSS